jgi:hypothetical protein
MFGYITLFSALSLAATAAWFAIVGIVALFGGNPIPVMIMGAGIELAKIVGVSWLYRNWEGANWRLKWPGVFLVIVVMLLTSMGIFGFLSKAHIEQNADVGNNTLQIERLDQRIAREQAVIDREQDKINSADSVIQQLDTTVSTLIEYDKISGPDGARAVREGQQDQRDALAAEIAAAQSKIDEVEDDIGELQDERLVLSQEVRELELEVGPVKYIAALIYEDAETNLEDAVRIVIIMFIFVFDPMAIWLLMAANHVLLRNQHMWGDEDDPHTPEPPPAPKAKKIVPNADAEFVPASDPEAERIAEEKAEMQKSSDKQLTQRGREKARLTHNDPTGKKRQRIN